MIASLIEQLLKELGEDVKREGLDRTPDRVEKALRYLTSGYGQDVNAVLNDALFVEDYDEMVVVKDIDFFPSASTPSLHRQCTSPTANRKIVGCRRSRGVEMYSRRFGTGAADTQIANHERRAAAAGVAVGWRGSLCSDAGREEAEPRP